MRTDILEKLCIAEGMLRLAHLRVYHLTTVGRITFVGS